MSHSNDNYFAAGNSSLTAPVCATCDFIVCQCDSNYTYVTPESNYSGAYMAPISPTYPPSGRVEDRYTMASPQSAEAFPHYSQQEYLPSSSYGEGRVHKSAFINTFIEGLYTYGQLNDEEARTAERLLAFNHSFIQANDNGATLREEVFETKEDITCDSTIDQLKLSLPIVGQKVPCPTCGVRLKDEKSLSRHFSRKHNSNVDFYGCQEPNCQYITQKRADVDRHVRAKHNQDADPKPFKCDLCGVGQNRKDNLKRHKVTCMRSALNELALPSAVAPLASA